MWMYTSTCPSIFVAWLNVGKILLSFTLVNFLLPAPVAARSKAWVCGRSPAEIAGSNPASVMDVCLL